MNAAPNDNAIRVLAVLDDTVISGKVKPVLAFARAARELGTDDRPVHVSMLTFVRNEDDPEFVDMLRREGFTVDVVRERRRFDPSVFRQLRTIVAEHNPHVLWTHGAKTHFLVRLAGLNSSRGWVASHHGYTATSLIWTLYDQLDRWSLRGADSVVTVCNAFATDLTSRLGLRRDRISVHRSPIAPSHFAGADAASIRRELGLPTDAKIVLSVGRLSKEKGHAYLIRAMALIRKDLGAKLVLIGDGPEQASLEALCRELDLTESVHFLGYRDDAAQYYAAADVFVLPSFSEGSPNVLLEAMDAGVPIVATAVGGIPEMVTHARHAWLVPSHDAERLARGIEEVLGNESLRRTLISEGKRSLEDYHPAHYYAGIKPLFERVARDRARTVF